MIILLSVLSFLCGALMFSYWLGLLANKKITTVGDGNPGAFNLWYAAGYKLGLLGILLDFSKGYLPVLLFIHLDWVSGSGLIAVAIAPILGHAFSPFLHFKGGKAIAVTFGVWSALTGFEVSIVFAVMLAVFKFTGMILARGKVSSPEADAFQVVTAFLLVSIYLYYMGFSSSYFYIWFYNSILFLYVNRVQLVKFFKGRIEKVRYL